VAPAAFLPGRGEHQISKQSLVARVEIATRRCILGGFDQQLADQGQILGQILAFGRPAVEAPAVVCMRFGNQRERELPGSRGRWSGDALLKQSSELGIYARGILQQFVARTAVDHSSQPKQSIRGDIKTHTRTQLVQCFQGVACRDDAQQQQVFLASLFKSNTTNGRCQ
jgi:hypothetical protein